MNFTDKLTSYDGAHYYRVPKISGCTGCALRNHPDTDCHETVQCMDDNGYVKEILIGTEEADVAKYVIARMRL